MPSQGRIGSAKLAAPAFALTPLSGEDVRRGLLLKTFQVVFFKTSGTDAHQQALELQIRTTAKPQEQGTC